MYRDNAFSQVVAVRNHSFTHSSLHLAFQSLLDGMDPPLPSMIKTGDRILVKPFLRKGSISYDSRLTSHPNVVRKVIEAVMDCGAVVTLGDEGSKKLREVHIQPDKQSIHDLAESSGASLVSFTKTGAKLVRGNLHFPRKYLISRAVLEVDAVVNCANFQPHGILGFSGAVKNMFNAVVGNCQGHLHELFPYPEDLAQVIVDVCGIVKPIISFLDLTTIQDPINRGILHPVGLLLAGYDPVALDYVGVRAVGLDKAVMPTIKHGGNQGLGCADLSRIKLSGLDWPELSTVRFTQVMTDHARTENLYDKTTRRINKTILRPRPMIVPLSCTGCGDCKWICPVEAIVPISGEIFKINNLACVDCHCCIAACEHDAINLQYIGIAKVVRRIMNQPLVA